MAQRRIIVLEFNELCPELLQRWMADGSLPNFKHFYDASQAYIAHADVDLPLEPWIQWYSMHTGLSYPQHHVRHLTDGPRVKHEHSDIWRVLLDAGYRVANCGSMNASGFRAPGSFFLPDPWCTTEQPWPEDLAAYQRVVLANVQENTNASGGLDRKAYLDFLRFTCTHGLSARSVHAVLKQLATERFSKGTSWRRAALLDKIQTDLFLHYWRRMKPDFSTFFLNSTAHFQHAYFHLLAPESFDLPASAFADDEHRDAILFGFQQMDRLLADFMALERQGVTLILATALSQQPNPGAAAQFYRPRNMKQLFNTVGVQSFTLLPVMAQKYSAEFPNQAAADDARTRLEGLLYAGEPAFEFSPAKPATLYFGFAFHGYVPDDAVLQLPSNDRPSIPFYELFYRMPHAKSGAHHPDSVLWFKTGQHRVAPQPVSILDLFPTLLDYFAVPVPRNGSYVREGRSLLPELEIERYAPPIAMVA